MIKLIKSYKYDNGYDYIKTFQTREEQDNYFDTLDKIVIDDTNYIKEHTNKFKVPYSYDYLVNEGINYILFNNGYKDIFAFIIEKEYISEDVTRLTFEIDVIQTYMFDFVLQKSFIERKNCSIDEITDFDEGLDIGEHKITQTMTSIDKIYKWFAMFNGIKQQQLIFNSNNVLTGVSEMPSPTLKPLTIIDGVQYPLHFMELKNGYSDPRFTTIEIDKNVGDTGSPSEGTFSEGKLSKNGFRFIKGYEGFAPYPYQDSSGYWTICYGVTLHGEKDIYNSLVAQTPVSEEEGAKVSYNLKNERYASKIKDRCLSLGVTKQCQFDALVSLAYNCGTGVILNDNSLTRAIKSNPNDENTIRPIWEKFYTTSNGVSLNGLIARRKQECNMYFGKNYELRKIALINSNGGISGNVQENGGNGWLPS